MKFIIAHISKPGSRNNNSYKNYYIEKTKNIHDNMKWDDNAKNTLEIGDLFLFYCWGTRVEIHKIVNITTDHTKRPSHWDINKSNVLHLSHCLNTYSFKQFGLYDPPYSEYKQGFKKKNVYDLHNYPKLQYELNRNKEITIDNALQHCSLVSQMIKNYYNMLSEQENICSSTGFISLSYRSDRIKKCFKHNLFENVDTVCRLIGDTDYFNNKNSLYNVSKSVIDDYKKIILQYCIGVGIEEILFNNSIDLTDAINLFCEDIYKSNKKYGNPCNWWCKDWDSYNAGNSYIFSN